MRLDSDETVLAKFLPKNLAERRNRKLVQRSGLFDEMGYLASYPDVEANGTDPITHYLRFGAAEGRVPSTDFDVERYLAEYPDIEDAGINPLLHFIKHGAAEGRNFPSAHAAAIDLPPITDFANTLNLSEPGFEKPRILILPAIFAVGGVERLTATIMRELSDRFQFVVVTNEPHRPDRGCLFDAIGPVSEAIFDLAGIADPSEHLVLLREICARFPPDLVWVCNGSTWYHQNVDEILSMFADTPVVDQQVYDATEGWVRLLTPDYASRVTRLIAINSKIQTVFDKRLSAGGRTDVIYHAIDESRLPKVSTSYQRSEESIKYTDRFVFIGRLAEQKRPLDLIEIARILEMEEPGVEFEMVGNGPLAGICAEKIQDLGLANVRLTPFTDNVAAIYESAAALILVSAFEGLPIVMLEALASGVPVLATDVGDVRKIAEELGGGCVVVADAIDCPDRMAGVLLDFYRDLDVHRAAAAAVSSTVRERFGASRVAEDYLDCWSRAWQSFADRDVTR